MTEMEKRLARRIANQRARLRQLETFKGWHWNASHVRKPLWMALALRLAKENADMRERLGIPGHPMNEHMVALHALPVAPKTHQIRVVSSRRTRSEPITE